MLILCAVKTLSFQRVYINLLYQIRRIVPYRFLSNLTSHLPNSGELMSAETFQPIQTAKEFELAMRKISPHLHPDSVERSVIALTTIKNNGMPNPSEYNLKSITAHNEDDLNVKLYLVTVPYQLAFLNGELSKEGMFEYLTPISTEGIFLLIKLSKNKNVTWPVTITA